MCIFASERRETHTMATVNFLEVFGKDISNCSSTGKNGNELQSDDNELPNTPAKCLTLYIMSGEYTWRPHG